jgi:dolichol-phosphate mannosyltransferase
MSKGIIKEAVIGVMQIKIGSLFKTYRRDFELEEENQLQEKASA